MNTIAFYKYQGAGNDFIIIDNRDLFFPNNATELIKKLCNRKYGIGADGLILLENSVNSDFKMVYFNSDGNQSTMCGNGGRCVVAFAKNLNLIQQETNFEAIDGIHFARIEDDNEVKLQMIDIKGVQHFQNHYFVNSGSPHHIQLQPSIQWCDVVAEGRKIRNGVPYFEVGVNVNFVEKCSENHFKIRTYERGVEDETLACGTGATAVAIAMFDAKHTTQNDLIIETLGGILEVSFQKENNQYKQVFLKGPATFVFKGEIEIQ